MADKVENKVSLGSLRHCLSHMFHSFGHIAAAVVDLTVDFLDFSNLVGGKSTTAKAYDIDTGIAKRFAGSFHKRRYIFVHKSSALHHDVRANVAELVNEASATDNCKIVYFNLSGQLAGIADYHVVADNAVVCNVAIGHDETVVADYGLAFGCCAAVYGDALAEHTVIAYDSEGVFSAELEVLRYTAQHCSWEDCYILAKARAGKDGDVAAYAATVAYFNVGIDSREWSDLDILAYLCLGIDRYELMGHALFVFDDLCHELTFTHNFFAHESTSFHHGHTAAHGCKERYMENQGVAGHYFLTELHIVDLHEVG